MADRKLEVLITAKEMASQAFKNVSGQVKNAAKALKEMDSNLKQTLESGRRWGAGISAAITGVGLLAIKKAADFESMGVALETAFQGNIEAAKAAQASITAFAAKTPYQLEDVLGAFLKLKNLGLDPSEEALTSYGNTASAMGKSLNDMIEAVADASTGEFERLKEFGIRTAVEGDKVKFTFQGITTEIGNNSEEIQKYLLDLGDTKFAGGMEKQSQTLKGLWSTLQDGISIALGQIGDEIVKTFNIKEVLQGVGEAIANAIAWFQALSPEIKKTIVIAFALVAALGAFVAVAATVGLAMPGIIMGLAAVKAAFVALTGPVGIVLALVALLAVAWAKDLGGIREKTMAIVRDVIGFFSQLKDQIISKVEGLLEELGLNWNDIAMAARYTWEFIKSVVVLALDIMIATVKLAWENIKSVFQFGLDLISGIVKIFVGIFKGDWSLAWDGVKQIFKGALDFIVNIVKNWGGFILDFFGITFDDVVSKFSSMKDKATAIFGGMLDWVKTKLGQAKDWIAGVISSIKDFFTAGMDDTKSVWQNGWTLIVNIARGVKDLVLGIFKLQWELIKGLFIKEMDFILGFFGTSWDEVVDLFKNAWNSIKATASDAVDAVIVFVGNVGDALIGLGEAAYKWGKNLLVTFAQGIKDFITLPIDAVKSMMSEVESYMGFHSPTEQGPGSDADTWGPNLIEMFADGIRDTAPKVYEQTEAMVARIRDAFGDNGEVMAILDEWQGDEILPEKFAEIAAKIEEELQGIEDDFATAKGKYDELNQKAGEALEDMRQKHEEKISDMTAKLDELRSSLSELQAAYNVDIQGVDSGIGQAVADQEQKIADLRASVAEEDDADRRAALQAQLDEELAALSEFMETAIGYEDEIEEARRRNALTDFERTIEDAQTKRDEITANFELKQALLIEEMQAVEDQKNAELLAYEEKKAAFESVKSAFEDMKTKFEAGLSSMASTAKTQVSAINSALNSLASALENLIGFEIPDITDIQLNAEGSGFEMVPQMAKGGVVTSPTLAMIGEGSMNEAVVPLPDGRRIPVEMSGGGQGSLTVQVNMGGVTISSDVDKEAFFQELETRLARAVQLKRAGSQA